MRRRTTLALAACWAIAWPGTAAVAPVPPTESPDRIFSVLKLREDLRVLRVTFEGAHAGLYRYTPKAAMDSAFGAVDAGLTRPATELEFYRRLAPLIDLIHDSHTSLTLSRATRWDIARRARVFPLVIRYVDGRMRIEANAGPDREIPIRGEILRINGHPAAEITQKVLLGRTTDGFIPGPKYHAEHRNFWFDYHALVDTSQVFTIAIRDPATGEDRVHRVGGVPSDSLPPRQFTTRRPGFGLEVLEGGRAALMSIPTFADTGLAGKLEGAFADIRRRGVRHLVIDVRGNNGGIDAFNTALLDHLVDHPYRFYRGFSYTARDTMALRYTEHAPRDFMGDEDLGSLTPGDWEKAYRERSLPELLDRFDATNPAAGVHGPAKEGAFPGELYLLVDGGSASSAAEVPALLHALGIGTIVGEEPNGAYQGVTAGILLRLPLPNTGIRAIVPLIAYFNDVDPDLFEGRGVLPDHEVAETLEDAIAGRDTALEFVLAMIREGSGR